MDKQEAAETFNLIRALALGKAKEFAHEVSRSGADTPRKIYPVVSEIISFVSTALFIRNVDTGFMTFDDLREIVFHALLVARYPASEEDYLDWQHATKEKEGLIP